MHIQHAHAHSPRLCFFILALELVGAVLANIDTPQARQASPGRLVAAAVGFSAQPDTDNSVFRAGGRIGRLDVSGNGANFRGDRAALQIGGDADFLFDVNQAADQVQRDLFNVRSSTEEGLMDQDSQVNRASAQERLEEAQLGMENAQLRIENAEFHQEETQLRLESSQVRSEDAKLRFEDAQLLHEDAHLRRRLSRPSSLAILTPWNVSAMRGEVISFTKTHRATPVTISSVAILIVMMPFFLCCCSDCLSWTDESNVEDDDGGPYGGRMGLSNKGLPKKQRNGQDDGLHMLLDDNKPGEEDGCWLSGWCFRRRALVYFVLVVVVVSISLGCILWQWGIMQPILAQFLLYFYVILFLSVFLSLLLCQFWGMLRGLSTYLQKQMRVIDGITSPVKTLKEQTQHKWLGMLDDGCTNESVGAGTVGRLGQRGSPFFVGGGRPQSAPNANATRTSREEKPLFFPVPQGRKTAECC